eukprot:9148646-Ditylum_brightwellii.AAC.2
MGFPGDFPVAKQLVPTGLVLLGHMTRWEQMHSKQHGTRRLWWHIPIMYSVHLLSSGKSAETVVLQKRQMLFNVMLDTCLSTPSMNAVLIFGWTLLLGLYGASRVRLAPPPSLSRSPAGHFLGSLALGMSAAGTSA